MYFSDKLGLITTVKATDSEGFETDNKVTRYVYADPSSIAQNEFFSASQAGIDAKYKFLVHTSEYSGESMAEYNGMQYNIYRTYQTKVDTTELYLSKALEA